MDDRMALPPGTVLTFSGTEYTVLEEVGRGSNAIVYRGRYADALDENLSHYVLIKELFPLHPDGAIRREGNSVVCDPEGQSLWDMHRFSFEAGNHAHLLLMETDPDQVGSNLNTYRLNNTLYTVMGLSGGTSLEALSPGEAKELRPQVVRMMNVLDALSAFHQNWLVHLDIAPDNILIIRSGSGERVILIDFNSCVAVKRKDAGDSLITSVKQGYTAPEIRNGITSEIGFPTDLYSVTAVFFRLITGSPLTNFQMIRSQPPDVSHCGCMQSMPDTVCSWVKQILRRGLSALPQKRYQTAEQMKRDFQELLDRIDGIGITHWALWEAGRRSVQRLVRQNESLKYVEKEADLYPMRVRWGEETLLLDGVKEKLLQPASRITLLRGMGGIGKSTVLLRMVLSSPASYSPNRPAMLYLPLSGWKKEGGNYILNHILQELKFDTHTRTLEDARHALLALLQNQDQDRPLLLLLLDGLNEAGNDTAELIGEINRFSGLPGMRVVITSRTAPQELRADEMEMIPLSEQNVNDELMRHGLLMPEKPEIRTLLQTPMMLSLFIKTAQAQNSQVLCETEDDLLSGYLTVLCGKASQDDEAARYQTEAALYMVLPAIAKRMKQEKEPLDDQALMRILLKCRKKLSSRAVLKAFPQWIGHRNEMIGGEETSADVWYGLIVQKILWRQMGLLVKDEAGRYHILHQIIQDYLIRQDDLNRRRILRTQVQGKVTAAVIVALCLCAGSMYYQFVLKPKPYNFTMSKTVIHCAWNRYAACINQYQAMDRYLRNTIGAKECLEQVLDCEESTYRSTQKSLADMMTDTNRVIPWSQAAFDFHHFSELREMPLQQAKAYQSYVMTLEDIRNSSTATPEVTSASYTDALDKLIKADQDVTQLLCQLVNMPHMNYDEEKQTWASLKENLDYKQQLSWEMSSIAQERNNKETMSMLTEALQTAYAYREEARENISILSQAANPEKI